MCPSIIQFSTRIVKKKPQTHVAPTVFNLRNSDENLYLTKRPALGSSSLSIISSSILSGFAISNRTAPVSISRILKRVKSMLYIFAPGSHR